MTVFLNSHLLSEVEMVCDRVAIVDQGRVVRQGPLEDLIGGITELRITLDRIDPPLLAILAAHGTVSRVEGCTAQLAVRDPEVAPTVAARLVQAGYRMYGMVPTHQSLEDVFLELVQPGER
jgi:ABC-2 type transport system ATP-binding protein